MVYSVCKMSVVSRSTPSLLICGAGITGSLTAYFLTEQLPMTVWEKTGGIAGRMSTLVRLPPYNTAHVDMGAQYLTSFRNRPWDPFVDVGQSVLQDLLSKNLISRFQGTILHDPIPAEQVSEHYVCSHGLDAVPRHYMRNSGAGIYYKAELKSVEVDTNRGVAVCRSTRNKVDEFGAVVLTMPVPQILALGGNLHEHAEPAVWDKLTNVEYSSRYALALVMHKNAPNDYIWMAKYFDHPVIRFACWDSLKYPHNYSCQTHDSTLLLHSTVPFALEHLEEDESAVEEMMMKALHELLPNLDPPYHTQLVKWRYSQVHRGYPGAPGMVILCHKPLVIATGDAFAQSNFSGCAGAALATSDIVKQFILLKETH